MRNDDAVVWAVAEAIQKTDHWSAGSDVRALAVVAVDECRRLGVLRYEFLDSGALQEGLSDAE